MADLAESTVRTLELESKHQSTVRLQQFSQCAGRTLRTLLCWRWHVWHVVVRRCMYIMCRLVRWWVCGPPTDPCVCVCVCVCVCAGPPIPRARSQPPSFVSLPRFNQRSAMSFD
jgi:hypothetical protein